MSKIACVPFSPKDWLAATRDLSAEEAGVYITLLCLMCEGEDIAAMEVQRLARICGLGVTPFTSAMRELVRSKRFFGGDGCLHSELFNEWSVWIEQEATQ